jgi:hypothetical protein
MDTLNSKLAELDKKEKDIQKKKDDLEYEERCLEQERETIEEERLKLSQILTPHEEEQLKKELTAVGELLELPVVISADLELISEAPPQPSSNLYKINITTEVTFDSGLTGLYIRANVQTLCPQVEAIVRSLFVQEGHVRERASSSLFWEKNWDYHTSIRLTSHEALSW